jgi:DHA1 family multidrug resistance protein-like MFS transporter
MTRRFSRFSPFFFLCLMGGLAIFSTTMSKNPALPLFISSLGVDEGTLGLIAAASTVVGVVVSLPAGILSDLWGRRNVILLSMAVFATAPFLYLLVTTPGQLVLVRVYHGLATAILGPVAMAAVADTFRAGRGERMAWYSSATMVGRFLAPSVGGLLIVGNDFHWVYLGCGVAGVLALVASLRWQSSLQPGAALSAAPKRTLSASWATLRGELGVVLRNKDILLTSLMEAAQYFAFGAVETFLPLYLISIGYSAWEIGPLFTAQILVTAVTKPALGRLSDRLGRKQFIAAGLISGAAVVAAMPYATNYWVLMALIGIFGLGVAAVTASTSALVSDLSRASSYGSALGVLSSIMDVGHSSGPAVVGFLVVYWHYGPAFAVVAGVLVVGAILFYALVTDPSGTSAMATGKHREGANG